MGNQRTIENLRFSPLDIWGFQQAAPIDYGLLYLSPSTATNDNAKVTGLGSNATDGTLFTASTLDFDGTNDTVNTNQTLAIDYDDAFEIEAHVNGTGVIVSNTANDTDKKGIMFRVVGTGEIELQLRNDGTDRIVKATTATLPVGEWHKIKVIYTGSGIEGGISFEIDDVVSDSTASVTGDITAGIDTAVNARLGAWRAGTDTFFNGQISYASVTINSVLAREWKLNESTGTVVYDDVTFVAGTISGAVWVNGLSGLENGETHNGIPQKANEEYNIAAGVNIPAKSSDQTEDVLGNPIAYPINVGGSQVAWNGLDGATGYLGGNYVYTGERTQGFKITRNDVMTFDLSASQVIFDNLLITTLRGIQVYINTAGAVVFEIYSNVTGSLFVSIKTPDATIVANTKYDIILDYDGGSLAAGMVITVNTVAQTPTVNQDTLGANTTVSTNTIQLGRRGFSDSLHLNGQQGICKFELI